MINNILKSILKRTILLIVLFLVGINESNSQCDSSPPGILAKWDFNSKDQQCNGAISKKGGLWNAEKPIFKRGQNSYCPQFNSGCGEGILGTEGHGNTYDFQNGMCLSGFWRNNGGQYGAAPGWDRNSSTFEPGIAGNVFIKYKFPIGKSASLTSISMVFLQKQFRTTVGFEKVGVGVYRNGVLIYDSTLDITSANVNDVPLEFIFPTTPDFETDGSVEVEYKITFGLVHRLLKKHAGLDEICLNGTCGESPSPIATITPSTCGPSGANDDGTITLINFGPTDRYDYNVGTTYTGGKTYVSATTIPMNGIIANNLVNPASEQDYTVRVFTSNGCTYDLNTTLIPIVCSVSCTLPTANTSVTLSTCTGISTDNNASILVNNITDGDKIGISMGTFYTGPSYNNADNVIGSMHNFTNLFNPHISQAYTIRIFNGGADCFDDVNVSINENSCVCKNIGVQIISVDQNDPDSSPNNGNSQEDDFSNYEVCKGPDVIDLKLTKTVSPNSGSNCPSNTDFNWTITVLNEGSMTATDILVTDNMPEDLIIISSSVTSGTFDEVSGWIIPSINAGNSATLTITTNALKAGNYENCAWISKAFPDNDPDSSPENDNGANEDDDDCATITVTGSNLPSVMKEFSPY